MDFRLTEDQTTLAASVREYLDGTHGPEVLRRLDVSGARDETVWRGLVEMGLTALLVPEDHGGLGLGLVEATLIALELGRAGVAEPVVDTAFVAVPWLVARGRTERLGEIAAGTLKVALAHPVNPWTADADGAGLIIPHDHRGGTEEALSSIDPLRRLFTVPAAAETPDAPHAALPADPISIPVELAHAEAADDAHDLLDLAALMTAAQLLGTAERMLALAVDYAQQREQFGQPIGAFQAVKHHCANMAVRNAFAHPVLLRATWALQERTHHASVFVSHAKLAAADAALFAAETAIQVHGAMGYTYEVDLHFWMKRAWALAGAWGDRAFHLRRLDAAIIGGALALGPDQTLAHEDQHA